MFEDAEALPGVRQVFEGVMQTSSYQSVKTSVNLYNKKYSWLHTPKNCKVE